MSEVRRIAADETSARRGHDYISLFVDMARRKVVYVADGKDAATVKEFADFLEAHGGRREAVTDASIDMGAAFEAGIKESFPNAEITFDKFHVIKLANEAVDQVRREEARNNFQIKGRRYIFLKNVDHLTQEEKEALSRLEAQNLDTIQAMQIRMNLQQLFTMSAKSARRFLDRWNVWVQVCDLAPMKRLAKTITAKSEGILRSIATGLSNGVLEAINGNVQAAKRKAKGYRTKRNLKASLDGRPVVEKGAVAYADLGSLVADELGGDHASAKHHPVPQANGALVSDADVAVGVGVDTRSALAMAKYDRAADQCDHAAQRAERVGPQAHEEAPHEVRVRIRGRGGAGRPSPLLGCRRARGRAPPNHRAGRDHAPEGHARAGQDDDATPEDGSGLDDDRSRRWPLQAVAQLVKVVVYHLAPRADPASVAYLN